MAEDGALAIDGPEAADPVGICGSALVDTEAEGGVGGIEGKLEDLWVSAKMDGVSR